MRAAGMCKASEERDTGMFVVGDVAGTASFIRGGWASYVLSATRCDRLRRGERAMDEREQENSTTCHDGIRLILLMMNIALHYLDEPASSSPRTASSVAFGYRIFLNFFLTLLYPPPPPSPCQLQLSP